MKNIAIICSSLNTGGAERAAGLLSKELEKFYNVYLFLLSTDNIVYDYGGKIVNIGGNMPFYEEKIKECKKRYQIDVSISLMEPFNFANVRTRLNEKVIISEHGVLSLIEPPLHSQEMQVRRYYNYADEIITVSEGLKYDLAETYGIKAKITAIYNLIDKENIINKSKEILPEEVLNFLDGKEYFLNAGRLEPVKNQKRLIRQYAHYRMNTKNAKKLIIIGTGRLENELKDLICKLNLERDIKIFPYMINPFAFMKNAFAMILSSKHESFSYVILEAMLLECPVISTNCLFGPRELLIQNYDRSRELRKIEIGTNGILVCNDLTEDSGESVYLSKAMLCLENDKNLYLTLQTNAKNYMKDYTNQKIIGQWLEVIERKKEGINGNGLNVDEELLKTAKHIFIFGAGIVGKYCLETLGERYKIEGFLVSKMDELTEYMGLPVLEVSNLKYKKDDVTIIIGVSDIYKDGVVRKLLENKYGIFIYPLL